MISRVSCKQHEQEMRELAAQQKKLTASLALMERELAISRKLAKSGAIPEIDLIRLERQYVDARGELDVLSASQPRLETDRGPGAGKA